MIASFVASVLLAATTSVVALPAAGLGIPFPDQGDPIAAEAYSEDLEEAGHINGKLPAEMLTEIETSPGCLLEEEAAEAWRRLEAHALRDGVEFTASWCYRSLKTQRRTYRRNCPWVIVDPVVVDPAVGDPGGADPGSESEPAAPPDSGAEAGELQDPAPQEPAPVERVRVCRVPTAKPGNSNHGWGRAIDITADAALLGCESEAFIWLLDNAGRYGWVHPQWAACGADKEEAWHWEWGGTAAYTGPNIARFGHFAA